jgi:UDP-glucose 4-epimerase
VLTWTIGAGGLIGAAMDARSERPFRAAAIPWNDPAGTLAAVRANLERFTEQAQSDDWAIIWAAGAAAVSSTDAVASREAEVFADCVRAIAKGRPEGRGVFFLTSSAGGIHAGSLHPPFSETTPPAPIGPYGRAKLAQEQAARTAFDGSVPLVIGRISNVYGPGQNLTKLQGLISRLALCSITREPLNLFVPLSTVRDYIYVDDVAVRAHAWIDAAIAGDNGDPVKVIASGQGTSVAQLVRIAQNITRRRVPIAMGTHSSSAMQAPDLRFVPSPLPGIQPALTPMPIGMKGVFDDIRWRLQAAIA